MLTDGEIRDAIHAKEIQIYPFPDLAVALGPCSLDLRLGRYFQEQLRDGSFRKFEVASGSPVTLLPGCHILAATDEVVRIESTIAARLQGRSGLGRWGVVVHKTADLIEPGYAGVVVLEFGHTGTVPFTLHVGDRVCALTFERLSVPVQRDKKAHPYSTFYGQTAPEAAPWRG